MPPDLNATAPAPTRPWVPPTAALGLGFAAAALALIALLGLGVSRAAAHEAALPGQLLQVEPQRRAPPPLRLPALGGGARSLPGGEPELLVLNFWATWCPPCLEELPSFKRLSARLADDPRIAFWAVATDETKAPVEAMFEGDPPPFSVLFDPEGPVAERWGTMKFPETYILRRGEIVGHLVGSRDWDAWYAEAYLRGLLDAP